MCGCGGGQLNPEPGNCVSTQEVHIKESIDSVGIYDNVRYTDDFSCMFCTETLLAI